MKDTPDSRPKYNLTNKSLKQRDTLKLMNKFLKVLGTVFVVLFLSAIVYKYFFPSQTCIQVLVSATNRITEEEKIFGDPCRVPFWYKDVRVYNPEQLAVEGTIPLGAPVAILAGEEYGVNLLLLSRECNRTYIIERSYNERDWGTVGTTTFYEYPPDAGTTCPKDFIDGNVAAGTEKIWYRYGLLDEAGNVIIWCDIGEVTMEEY